MHIKVKNLSLTYSPATLENSFLRKNLIYKMFGKLKNKNSNNQLIHALKNINFELKKGDRLGVIGKNGSGKSTLIQCLSKIIFPNPGSSIDVDGKYLPIIEPASLAEGVDTVKNNILLIGLLLGFKKKEIIEKTNEILDFSEIKDYQNLSYNTLSTGMRLKLIFSIVFLLDSEIFLIDEFLTTGDARFRKKGFDFLKKNKIENSITVLCSHDRNTIKEYCNKVIVLDNGDQKYFGDIDLGFELFDKLVKL